jgi:hypothetical protein
VNYSNFSFKKGINEMLHTITTIALAALAATNVTTTDLTPQYTIVHERPQTVNEIYCPEDMSLTEWWTINPPNDGFYDNWDDENNSPDLI